MLVGVKGLILRAVDVKEADRLVTIFTEEYGVVTAVAKGARSLRSRQMSSTMPFCYGNFVLYKKGDLYWVREAELIESFFDLRKTLAGLALASYVAEVTADVAISMPEPELLRLALNSLYAIATGKHDLDRIKAVFEVRCASVIGFMPDVIGCAACGRTDGEFYLDVMGGTLLCPACRDGMAGVADPTDDGHERHVVCILSAGAKWAFEYAAHCPADKLFSFRLEGEDRALFSRAAEEYLLHHLERSFKTLDFYKEVSHP